MQKTIEATGKTIDLAIQAGLEQLGMDRDEVSVEVLEQPRSGFFGIGASPAKVSLTFKVGTKMYKQIKEKDFVLAVTYEDLLSNPGNGRFRPHLRSIPDGVSQVRFTPEEVEYLIEQVEEGEE